MKQLFNRLSLLGLASIPTAALAHPGHGMIEGWAHYFTPEHVLPALVAVGILVYFLRRKKNRE
jgi:hydrogenase/urease accessory protein HupE